MGWILSPDHIKMQYLYQIIEIIINYIGFASSIDFVFNLVLYWHCSELIAYGLHMFYGFFPNNILVPMNNHIVVCYLVPFNIFGLIAQIKTIIMWLDNNRRVDSIFRMISIWGIIGHIYNLIYIFYFARFIKLRNTHNRIGSD